MQLALEFFARRSFLVLAYQRYRKFQASCSAADAVMPEGYPKS